MHAFFHYFVHAREDVRARFQISNPPSMIVLADPSFADGTDDRVGTYRANTQPATRLLLRNTSPEAKEIFENGIEQCSLNEYQVHRAYTRDFLGVFFWPAVCLHL
jgi:hypothetical protein